MTPRTLTSTSTPPAPVPEPEPETPILPDLEPAWHIPQFALRIEDLAHPGVSVFLSALPSHTGGPSGALRDAVLSSYAWLYTPQTAPRTVQRITLILRAMPGVAHACGDAMSKEIHFSLDYILKSAKRAEEEVRGVLTHEVVHCLQYNALGTCPGGLIEGIADYVRLRAGLAPPHWKKAGGADWDAGYDRTAYFLDWLEERYGDGTVMELNARMHGVEYDERIFKQVTGRPVRKLWRIYCASLEGAGA